MNLMEDIFNIALFRRGGLRYPPNKAELLQWLTGEVYYNYDTQVWEFLDKSGNGYNAKATNSNCIQFGEVDFGVAQANNSIEYLDLADSTSKTTTLDGVGKLTLSTKVGYIKNLDTEDVYTCATGAGSILSSRSTPNIILRNEDYFDNITNYQDEITSASSVEVETEDNSILVEVFTDIFSINSTLANIAVYINGSYDSTLQMSGDGVEQFAIPLPFGLNRVKLINGVSSRPITDILGTRVQKIIGASNVSLVNPTYQNKKALLIGDSITVGAVATLPQVNGYGSVLRTNNPSTSIVIEGFGNASMFDYSTRLNNLLERVGGLNPNIIYIALGTNDYGLDKWSDISGFKTAYDSLLDSLHSKYPTAVIITQTPIIRASETANPSGYTLQDFRNEIITSVGSRNWATLEDGTQIVELSDLADGLHPNTAGHLKYATNINHYFTNNADVIVGNTKQALRGGGIDGILTTAAWATDNGIPNNYLYGCSNHFNYNGVNSISTISEYIDVSDKALEFNIQMKDTVKAFVFATNGGAGTTCFVAMGGSTFQIGKNSIFRTITVTPFNVGQNYKIKVDFRNEVYYIDNVQYEFGTLGSSFNSDNGVTTFGATLVSGVITQPISAIVGNINITNSDRIIENLWIPSSSIMLDIVGSLNGGNSNTDTAYIPSQDGNTGLDVLGNVLTNTSGKWHNGCETTITDYPIQALIDADLPQEYLFVSGVPQDISYSDLAYDVQDKHITFCDVSTPNKYKNRITYEVAQSDQNLINILKYVNAIQRLVSADGYTLVSNDGYTLYARRS